MKVKDLIQKLQKFDSEMDIVISTEMIPNADYSDLNEARVVRCHALKPGYAWSYGDEPETEVEVVYLR